MESLRSELRQIYKKYDGSHYLIMLHNIESKILELMEDAYKKGYEQRVVDQLQTALNNGKQSSSYNSKELDSKSKSWIEKKTGHKFNSYIVDHDKK